MLCATCGSTDFIKNGNQLICKNCHTPMESAETKSNNLALDLPSTVGMSATELHKFMQKATLKIETDSGIGTGWFVDFLDTKDYIVTNAHVVQDAKFIAVSASNNLDTTDNSYIAIPLHFDTINDLCILKLMGTLGNTSVLPNRTTLTLASKEDYEIGTQVATLGYPCGLNNIYTVGRISGLGRNATPNSHLGFERILIDITSSYGNSGGVVCDTQGRAIGVITSGQQALLKFDEQRKAVFDNGHSHQVSCVSCEAIKYALSAVAELQKGE